MGARLRARAAAQVEPLMGWTSSADMRQQVHLAFDTGEEAMAYAERHGIPYQVFEPKPPRAPAHLLCRQFRLQAPRSLDALTAGWSSKISVGWPLWRASDGPGRRHAAATATGTAPPASADRVGSPGRGRSPCWSARAHRRPSRCRWRRPALPKLCARSMTVLQSGALTLSVPQSLTKVRSSLSSTNGSSLSRTSEE